MRRKRDSKPLILVVAPVAYNLLTMLLLCGPSHRYFYYASVIVVPIALFCFRGVVLPMLALRMKGIRHESAEEEEADLQARGRFRE